MTEIGGLIAINHPFARANSVGELSQGATVKIIDGNGDNCSIGKDGEICFKTFYPFNGYYNNQEATDQTTDQSGWIHSGDIGHFDENGFLYIVDRIKDILKYCNYQISPTEIENVIIKLNGVASVCVVGIPDLLANELPAAVIVRNDEYDVTEQMVIDIVNGMCVFF